MFLQARSRTGRELKSERRGNRMSSNDRCVAAAVTAALMFTCLASGAQAAEESGSLTPFVYKRTNLVADTHGTAATPSGTNNHPRNVAPLSARNSTFLLSAIAAGGDAHGAQCRITI
jgi:hypothetical protein